jgi:hypothetical protein
MYATYNAADEATGGSARVFLRLPPIALRRFWAFLEASEMEGNGTVSHRGNGRGTNGRFAAGNGYGRGSPVAKRMHEFRQAILQAGEAETLQGIFRKLGEMALAGDTTAAKLYIEYLAGRPVQPIQVSVPEVDAPLIPPALQQAIIAVPRAMELLHELEEVLGSAAEPAARNGRVELRRILDDVEDEKQLVAEAKEELESWRAKRFGDVETILDDLNSGVPPWVRRENAATAPPARLENAGR